MSQHVMARPDGDPGHPARLAVLAGLVVLGATFAATPLAVAAHAGVLKNSVLPALLILPYWAVGVAVARREPRNPIGWILIAAGAFVIVGLIDAELYTVVVYNRGDGGLPLGGLAVVAGQCWPAALLCPPLAILLFPDGHLPSGRWRAVVAVYLAASAVLIADQLVVGIAAVVDGTVRIASAGYLETPPPTALRGTAVGATGAVLLLTVVACCVAFVGRRVVSYRRAHGERRQQLKWVMCGSAVTALSIPAFAFLGGAGVVVQLAAGLGVAALPVCIGIGILRYRLYEIDVIIRRTLVYTALAATLSIVYLAGIYLVENVLQIVTGQSGTLAVTVSTLFVAGAFQPLRGRIQRAVDHRFYRRKYDAARTLDGFAARLRQEVDLSALQSDVLGVVNLTVQPRHASLWLRTTGPPADE